MAAPERVRMLHEKVAQILKKRRQREESDGEENLEVPTKAKLDFNPN